MSEDWPQFGEVTEVEWIDSASTRGWHHHYDSLGVLSCRSVGYLHSEDDEVIRLLQSVNDGGGMGELIIIPRVAVRSVRTLSVRGAPCKGTSLQS